MQREEESLSALSLSSSEAKPVTYALKFVNSDETKIQHASRLRIFFKKHLKLEGEDLDELRLAFLNKVKSNERGSQWMRDSIIDFIDSMKKEKMQDNTSDKRKENEITGGTIQNYYQSIKMFYETFEEDLPTINWKKLSKILPKSRKSSDDRAPTKGEIRKAIHAQDRRVKPIILTMCSSGIRLGAWEYLRWKHLTPIKNDKGEIIAAKLIVYGKEHDQYYTFITPEAYHALQEYMDFRELHGEKITPESWIIRDDWKIADVKINNNDKIGGRVGLATHPRKIQKAAIKNAINRALYETGVRQALQKGQRRHEWKLTHGFRKFFKTYAEQVMNHSNVELLISHADGLQKSYYKPIESDVLKDYLKAVEVLTIDYEKTTLAKQVVELQEKSKEDSYIIKGKLAEKEQEIEEMRQMQKQQAEQDQKRFKEMEERMESIRQIALKQAFRVIEKEVEANPLPSIEGADKMTAQEVLFEMQKRGGNTLAFDKVSEGVEV